MAFAKVETYTMDRRQLLRMTGSMGVAAGAAYICPELAYAAEQCDKLTISDSEIKTTKLSKELQYWIDGLHFGNRSDLKSRANLSLFMDLKQDANQFVETVVIMDSQKKILGVRYFDSSNKMLDGRVPYVVFDNIELDHTQTYRVIYTVRSGTNLILYSAQIVNPEISRLNTTFLPKKMVDDFKTFLVGNKENKTPGLITTQYQFYTVNGLSAHTARGRVVDMAADGSSFKVNIDFMHADVGPDHYMRYFIVMDPVGRLLGFFKRQYNQGGASGTLDVVKITPLQKADYAIPDLQVANIADCPYIQLYTEDSYDAVARSVLRFR